jgi:Domain of unknown function (DUF1852)
LANTAGHHYQESRWARHLERSNNNLSPEFMPPSDLLTCLKQKIRFTAQTQPYDANYTVDGDTRATTNFANFARNPSDPHHSISVFLSLVNSDLNKLLGHNPSDQCYVIRLEILSIRAHLDQDTATEGILMTEVMRAGVVNSGDGSIQAGPTGMNYSSYLRDYDFRIVLPSLLQRNASPEEMVNFGVLHGLLSRLQFGPQGLINDSLAVAISISQNCDYTATATIHPLLGQEYKANRTSLTDQYFAQMALFPRFFRPPGYPAPIAFYATDSLVDQSDFYLASLIAVMGNFQRIYRPEIYLSQVGFLEGPGEISRASLSNTNYTPPALVYDRQERELLSDSQARLIEARFIKPCADWIGV